MQFLWIEGALNIWEQKHLTFSVLLNWTFRICQTSQIFTLENPKATIILEWRGYIWIYIVHEYILKNMQLTSVHAWFQI